MGSRNRLTDPAALVGDTSTVINLNATGRAQKSCARCRSGFLWSTSCRSELDRGRRRGRSDATCLERARGGKIDRDRESRRRAPKRISKGWSSGRPLETLDDGEAATIAYAAAGRDDRRH